jgi:uncharacterized protein (DUF111 family)
MTRILYWDCFSGISGDMALAALVDAGADQAYIESELRKLAIEPFALEWKRVNKCGISALKLDVVHPETGRPIDEHPGHGYDHDYHHGEHHHHHGEHQHEHGHHHSDHEQHHEHVHHHDHAHDHQHHDHGHDHQHDHEHDHHHRRYKDIVEIINKANFNERVTSLSLAIFERIAVSEAKIHGLTVEQVHFHEVGAVDSIVDIAGVSLAIDSLGIDQIISAPVPLGSGMVLCAHGRYPVPAPATLDMMKGLPIAPSSIRKELTTPTGAGIASGIVDEFSPSIPKMVIESIGYGAGTRDLPDQPNVLRAVIGGSE